MRPISLSKERGVALISVLLVFALVAILAADMLAVNFKDLKKTNNQLQSRQAFYYALGAEQLARQYLYRDYERDKKIDGLKDLWAAEFDAFNIHNGQMTIRIHDLQGRFNLNNLYDSKNNKPESQQLSFYKNLEQQLSIRPSTGAAITDWLDKDSKVLSGGAEDNAYSNIGGGYLAANNPLVDVSELRLIDGMDYKAYSDLKPYVSTLPAVTKVNLNTAESYVLKAIAKDLNSSDLKQIAQLQKQGGYNTVAEWLSKPFGAKLNSYKQYFTVSSDYFEVSIKSIYDGRLAIFNSTLYRDPKDGSIQLLKRHIDQ